MERRLDATDAARAHFEDAAQLLADDPAQVFSPPADIEARYARRLSVTLTAPLGGGASVVQTVVLELGPPERSPDAIVLPMAWRPIGHPHLLPVFQGCLEAAPHGAHTRLSLHGTYRPPLGLIGTAGDALAGRHLAHYTLAALLRTVAQRLDKAIVTRRTAEGIRPAPYPPDLRDAPARAT